MLHITYYTIFHTLCYLHYLLPQSDPSSTTTIATLENGSHDSRSAETALWKKDEVNICQTGHKQKIINILTDIWTTDSLTY